MYEKEFEVMLKAIKEASSAILDIYNKGFEVKIKSDNSEVTNADLASERIIKGYLSENFKDYAILSEETMDNKERLKNDYCFIIDPLDGTKDFVNKTNNFAINLALSYKKEIVVGLIAVPYQHIIYYGIKGEGAFKIENGKTVRIHVSDKTSLLTMVTSRFFFIDKTEFNNKDIIKEKISIGSSYKAGLIAEGKADFCMKLDASSKEWDTAPSEVIIREAGGIMTDIYGNNRLYNKEDYFNHDGFIIANNETVLNMFKIKK